MIQCFWLEPTGEEVREELGTCTATYYPLRRTDTGEVYKHFQEAPPGAMMDCDYLKEFALPESEAKALSDEHIRIRKHPDGRVIMVKTPGGDWILDQISLQGNFWTRTGEPPNITANPSIITGNYHGWLKNGVLSPA
jgi:hypothetical protein